MLDDRRDWIEHGHNTEFTDQEWDFYTYSQFAIDDGYEWHNWCVAKYPALSNRELQGKIASFEKQQQAIYELFEVSEDGEAGETLTEARFYRKFEGKLTGMECCDVWDKLTYNEKRDAHAFYLIKKRIFDATLAGWQKKEEVEEAQVELLTVEEEEEKAKTRLAELRSAHDESKPGLISSTCLAAGTGAVILQSPLVATPAYSTLTTTVASTLSGAIASNLTTACDTLLPLVTTQNVSLAIAGTAGVLAAVGCRKAVRFWRGTARKGEAVKGATQDLEKVTEEKRKIDALIEEKDGELKRLRKTVETYIEEDNTGTVFDDDEDEKRR
mmetsp:Transcript_45406/g.134330  ORF Transcript_45406/g.134330 Transcript_45406/m.134330 type:complete len:327 (+) Transcript_45406:66-1046(+)